MTLFALVAALATGALADDAVKIEPSTFGGLRARSIGPAAMGGRIAAIDANADTGCSDLALDSQLPNVLYAGMWQFRRQPDFFNSGGPGSGLYKSTDGGEHWQKLTNGIPAGNLGRIAVAPAPSRPSVVYA